MEYILFAYEKSETGRSPTFATRTHQHFFQLWWTVLLGWSTIVIWTKISPLQLSPGLWYYSFSFFFWKGTTNPKVFSKLTWWLQNLQDQCFTKFSHAIISSVPLLPLSISISSSIWGRLDFLQRIWYDFLIYGRFPLRAIMDALIHGISLFLYQWTEAKHKKISAHLMFVVFDSNTYSISRKDNHQISECDKRYPSFRLSTLRWCCTAKVM